MRKLYIILFINSLLYTISEQKSSDSLIDFFNIMTYTSTSIPASIPTPLPISIPTDPVPRLNLNFWKRALFSSKFSNKSSAFDDHFKSPIFGDKLIDETYLCSCETLVCIKQKNSDIDNLIAEQIVNDPTDPRWKPDYGIRFVLNGGIGRLMFRAKKNLTECTVDYYVMFKFLNHYIHNMNQSVENKTNDLRTSINENHHNTTLITLGHGNRLSVIEDILKDDEKIPFPRTMKDILLHRNRLINKLTRVLVTKIGPALLEKINNKTLELEDGINEKMTSIGSKYSKLEKWTLDTEPTLRNQILRSEGSLQININKLNSSLRSNITQIDTRFKEIETKLNNNEDRINYLYENTSLLTINTLISTWKVILDKFKIDNQNVLKNDNKQDSRLNNIDDDIKKIKENLTKLNFNPTIVLNPHQTYLNQTYINETLNRHGEKINSLETKINGMCNNNCPIIDITDFKDHVRADISRGERGLNTLSGHFLQFKNITEREISDIKNDISDIKNDISDIRGSIRHIDEEISDIKNGKNLGPLTISPRPTSYNNRGNNNMGNNIIGGIRTNITRINSTILKVQSNITIINSNIGRIDGIINNITNYLESISSYYNQTIQDNIKKLGFNLSKNIDFRWKDLENKMWNNITSTNSSISKIGERMDSLESNINNLSIIISSLSFLPNNFSIDSTNSLKILIEMNLGPLNKKINNISNDHSNDISNISLQLKTINDSLQMFKEKYETDLNNLRSRYKEINETLTNLDNQLEALKVKDTKNLESKDGDIKYSGLDKRIKNLETLYNNFLTDNISSISPNLSSKVVNYQNPLFIPNFKYSQSDLYPYTKFNKNILYILFLGWVITMMIPVLILLIIQNLKNNKN